MISTRKLAVPTLITAAVITVAAINHDKLLSLVRSDDTAPKPVDFSVSLECRALEGPLKQIRLASVRDYEQAYVKAKRDGNWGEINDNPAFKGTIYDESVRIAFNHGPDRRRVVRIFGGHVSKRGNTGAHLLCRR